MPFRGDICQSFNATMFRSCLRKKYKRSETFAKRVGVSRQAVDAWRNGQKKPTWRHLIKIAEVLKVAPRQLIIPSKRHILDKWEDHLIDYLEAPPEIKHEEIIKIRDGEGGSTTTKTVSRELKLTTKEAIELSDKLGHFEGSETDSETDDPRSKEMSDDIRKIMFERVDEEDDTSD